MLPTQSPLKIDGIAARFALLLGESGTSLQSPTLQATWRAFAQFCREPVECDDERFFFEADLSSTRPDSFYVHFSRTCYGREPKGYVWSHEVICDFIFPLTQALEEFNCTVEAEELEANSPERAAFFVETEAHSALWHALSALEPVESQIYIGES